MRRRKGDRQDPRTGSGVEFVPVGARRLVVATPDMDFWTRPGELGPFLDLDLGGALVWLQPPPAADEAWVRKVAQHVENAGAGAVRVLPPQRPRELPADALAVPPPRRPLRQIVLALAAEAAVNDRAALLRLVETTLAGVGL